MAIGMCPPQLFNTSIFSQPTPFILHHPSNSLHVSLLLMSQLEQASCEGFGAARIPKLLADPNLTRTNPTPL